MDEMLTPKEAAELLRLSVYTVKDYARRGVLPAVKVGNVWRFPKGGLSRWLAGQTADFELPSDVMVAHDTHATPNDPGVYKAQPGYTVLIDRRRAASETLDAIRSRAKPGDLQELLDEHREEVRKRSERLEE